MVDGPPTKKAKNVIQLYICVSVVLSWHYCRKESEQLDINLDSAVCGGCHTVFAWWVIRESVNMYFFKVFEYQGGMSARFDPHTLGLGGESVAQGCKNLPPVAI
jgi:hypothetical protein